MTLKTAFEWPSVFVTQLDNFSGSSIVCPIFRVGQNNQYLTNPAPGQSGRQYGASGQVPATAGILPTDVIERKYTQDRSGNKTYYWLNKRTGETYLTDPRPALAATSSGRATNSAIATETFVRSGYIGIVIVNARGARPIAYELWKKQGTTVNEETGDNVFIRNNGNFSITTSQTMRPYPEMRGSSDRYALRKKGGTYRTVAEAEKYKNEVGQLYGDTVVAELERSGFNFQTSSYGTGTVSEFGELAEWLATNEAVLPPLNFGGGGGSGSGGSGRNNRTSATPAPPELPIPAITITTRMPRGYVGRGSPRGDKPQMVQRYLNEKTLPNGDRVTEHADDIHVFRYVPQGIKYSGLSGQWVEVPRAEDIPFVDWASWQLMKVSFSFIVADERTEPGGAIVPDGLEISVDGQIEQLRRMAQRKVPVTLVNFDEMLTFQLRRGSLSNNGTQAPQPNMEFVITDFSVTATRRTTVPATGNSSIPSLIAVAQCEITLTEIPVETVGIIALPPITTPGLPPSIKSPPGAPNGQRYEYITDIMASPDRAYNSYLPNDNIQNTPGT